MANVYVWSGAVGAGTGADWTNAYTTLVAAATAKAAGDVFWVAHDHYETSTASKTVALPGVEGNSCKIFCANRAGSVPPVAADLRETGIVETTTTGAITLSGACSECYGMIFRSGSGATATNINISTSNARSWKFISCFFHLATTGAGARVNCGSQGVMMVWENCQVKFAAVGQGITPACRMIIRSATIGTFVHATSFLPTTLMQPITGGPQILMEGLDLSNLTGVGGCTLCTMATAMPTNYIIKDCKLGTGVTVASSAGSGGGGPYVTLIRSDSTDTNYRHELYSNSGILTTDTGALARTGGANDGTTTFAWKLFTWSPVVPNVPFECPPIVVWNETIGSAITITIHGYWATTPAVPTNQDVWMDVLYLGTSGFPIATKVSTMPGLTTLTTASALAAGSGWAGAGAPWKMAVTITPQEKGPITIYVKLLKSGTTLWIDPKPVIT